MSAYQPTDPWAAGVRASDVPIVESGGPLFERALEATSDINTRTVLITFFRDTDAKTLRTEELTLPELARRIAEQTATSKAELPLLKLSSFGSKRSGKGSLRTNANVLSVTGIEVEHDAGDVPFDVALEKMQQARIRCLLYTTPSYVPGSSERWRVLVPFSQHGGPEVREKFVARLNGLFDNKLARESFALSQAYYYGHTGNAAEHRVEVVDGDFLDLRDDTYAGSIYKDGSRVGNQAAETGGGPARATPRGNDDPQPVDLQKLEAALSVISSDCPYDTWLKVAAAIRCALGEFGFEFFDRWSAKATGNAADGTPRYTVEKAKERWRGARTMTDISIGTIFYYADQADPGWRERYSGFAESTPAAGNGLASAPSTPTTPPISATPFVWRDPMSIPRREWLYGYHLIRKFVSATIAPGGVGKSSLMIVEALAMATGRPLLGVRPPEQARVWYWNGEDPLEEIERRIAAACLHYGIKPEEIEGWLYVNSGRDSEIVIAKQTTSGAVIAEPVVRALIKTITDNQIDVVMIDPFISSHRVTENDNNAVDTVGKTWSRIADVTGVAIDLSHHSRKTGGNEVTVEDGRGAVALLNAVRSARVLNTMAEKEATEAAITDRRSYFRLENGKANLARPPEKADWHQLLSVDLGNGPPTNPFDGGDKVAVVTSWERPNPLDSITGRDFDKVAVAIWSGFEGGKWRENSQAKGWVGHAVGKALGLDMTNPAHKAKVKQLLKAWFGSGSLRVVEERERGTHKMRKFVEVTPT